MCGGPSQQQTQAADQQLALEQQMAGIYAPAATAESKLTGDLSGAFEKGQSLTEPFYSNLLENGLPYFGAESDYSSSGIGKQFNAAKARLDSSLAGSGSNLPSGYKDQLESDLSTNFGEAFDQNMQQLLQQQTAAKMAGEQGLSPLGFASTAAGANSGLLNAGPTAVGANQSVMNAPLQNNFWSNLLGGVLGAGGTAVGGMGAGGFFG